MSAEAKTFVLINPQVQERCVAYVAGLVRERFSSPWRITIEPDHQDFTCAQLRTFWMWCREAALQFREAGVSCAEGHIHDAVLKYAYGTKPNPIDPTLLEPARTLTKPRRMKKVEKTELLNHFQVWASEHSIRLTQPDPSIFAMPEARRAA